MAVIDSHTPTTDGSYSMRSGSTEAVGQSFPGNGQNIGEAKFKLRKNGSPTGNGVAKIYAHDGGTYGSTGRPTGAALATSGNLDVSTISTTAGEVTLTFSGANQIALTNGTNYVLAFEFAGGDAFNTVEAFYDGSSPTHGGNLSYYFAGAWAFESGRDLYFIINSAAAQVKTDNFLGFGFI